jgi:hypothetical protein
MWVCIVILDLRIACVKAGVVLLGSEGKGIIMELASIAKARLVTKVGNHGIASFGNSEE